jgi:hypothetical protein
MSSGNEDRERSAFVDLGATRGGINEHAGKIPHEKLKGIDANRIPDKPESNSEAIDKDNSESHRADWPCLWIVSGTSESERFAASAETESHPCRNADSRRAGGNRIMTRFLVVVPTHRPETLSGHNRRSAGLADIPNRVSSFRRHPFEMSRFE